MHSTQRFVCVAALTFAGVGIAHLSGSAHAATRDSVCGADPIFAGGVRCYPANQAGAASRYLHVLNPTTIVDRVASLRLMRVLLTTTGINGPTVSYVFGPAPPLPCMGGRRHYLVVVETTFSRHASTIGHAAGPPRVNRCPERSVVRLPHHRLEATVVSDAGERIVKRVALHLMQADNRSGELVIPRRPMSPLSLR